VELLFFNLLFFSQEKMRVATQPFKDYSVNLSCSVQMIRDTLGAGPGPGMIEKEWLCIEKRTFKLKAKIHIIQNDLQLWKYVQ